MFETFGKDADPSGRKESTLRKLNRLNTALQHREPDRVPISDFFWGGFKERWRKELGLAGDADPYYYYDLDWIVTVPNMDPLDPSVRDAKGELRGGPGQDRLWRDHAQAFPVSHARDDGLGDRRV